MQSLHVHLDTIYRDFDIRGKYPEEISPEEVYKIASALTHHYGVKNVAIGFDIRPSALELYSALEKGFIESGVHVTNLGLCTTPMTYFIGGSTDIDMTVMITASHMPSQYNGLKITVEDAKPISKEVIQELRTIVGTHTFSQESTHGTVTTHALQSDWIQKFKSNHNLTNSNLSIVIDPANMIGILEIDTFKAFEPDITVHTIFDEYDHTAPNHEANPVKYETLKALAAEVIRTKSNLGIAFDGDADRVGFVDETGIPVPSDIIGALLSQVILKKTPGATIVHDVRCSKVVPHEITRLGGTPLIEKVGHINIRRRMRETDAALGIELSGHFFFKESYFSEGGALPAFLIMELLKETGKPLSELARAVTTKFHSGEVNSTIIRPVPEIFAELISEFPTCTVEYIDGLSLTADSWWCNIRPSANDPVVRLNLEADTSELMVEKRDQILSIIRR